MSRVQLAPGHGREYETIYILRPNTDREIADGVANRVSDAIKGEGGLLTQAELWGSRRLAYPIKKHYRGTYVYVKYLGRGGTVGELERQLRLNDAVIRFQTIQLGDNIPMADVKVDESELELDFDIPFEADEPELTRERELGLDAVNTDRRRGRRDDRDDRDSRDDSDDDDDSNDDDDSSDDVKPKAKAKAKADDSESDSDDDAKGAKGEEEEE
ncbi:MAG: 30S ribosomal protein S6 [Polyangiaceae bacterium]